METEDSREIIPKKNSGFVRGIFIALLSIFLALLLLIFLTLALSLPSRKQLERLENDYTGPVKSLEKPGVSGAGSVVVIPEDALTELVSAQLASVFTDYPSADYLGLDIRLENETIDLLTGFRGTVPRINIRPKTVVGIRARIGMTNDGQLSVTPESAKIGRLPLPTGRIFRIVRRNPDFSFSGISLDDNSNRFLIDPEIRLSGLVPGMRVRSVRAAAGSLRIAADLPESLEKSLRAILIAVSADKKELISNLEAALPDGNKTLSADIERLFSSIQDFETGKPAAEEEASVSYLEGNVTERLPEKDFYLPADFGDRLPEGTRVRCGTDSFAEIILPGDHLIKLTENSELEVIETEKDGPAETLLSLLAGKARFLISPLDKNEHFRMTAGQAAMAVRGTDFVVIIGAKETVTLAVLEGSVAVNDKVIAEADQSVSVLKKEVGLPEPIDERLRGEIEENMGFRTTTADSDDLFRGSIVNIAVPHVMNAAAAWAALDTDVQWDVQHVIEDYIKSNPEISLAVDDFFRVNGLEDRRGEFEALFE